MIDKDENTLLEAVARLTPQWLAGFFDGEGCVHASLDPRGRTYIKVQLNQKDPIILGLIGLKFPPSYTRARSVPTKSGGTTTGHMLSWEGYIALDFLSYIKDHVIVKRKLVELAIEFCDHIGTVGSKMTEDTRRTRMSIYSQIKQINTVSRAVDEERVS